MNISADKIAIIILHFGCIKTTARCISSLHEAYEAGAKIIISCNSSKSETHALAELLGSESQILSLEDLDSYCTGSANSPAIISNNENRGFAAGNNIGARVAECDESIKWLWFLNNDIVVEPGSFNALLDTLRSARADQLFGATVVDLDDPENVQCAGGNVYNPYLSITKPYCGGCQRNDLPSSLTVDLDYIFGASLCVSKDIFQAVGGFCEDYFLYYEELDFCDAAARSGCSLNWAPHVVIRHEGAASTQSKSSEPEKRDFSHYHENYSTFKYTGRNHLALLPLVILTRVAAKHILLPLRGEAYLLKSFWRALFDFLRKRKI